MAQSLLIVESPAKARTLKKYLGRKFNVLASVGHVKDLPKKELGIDVDHDFKPQYVTITGKQKVLKKITDAAKECDEIYLAPDPDREGEAIAWHIAEEIKKKTKKKSNIHRVRVHEITKSAVQKAIANAGELNANLFDAQQARRILDRLVGYKISPILWKKVRRGLSAGRVQSVALRIICEREAAIEAFQTKEYWTFVSHLQGGQGPEFEAKLAKINGQDFEVATEDQAGQIAKDLEKQQFILEKITKSERKRKPTPPFITSKLQQEAARKLGFSAKKTMMLAQRLYEGIELGKEGHVGLITYMRTDSVRVSDEALEAVRAYINDKYGADHLPETPNVYKSKKSAQEAHEAIRPTSLDYPPEKLEDYLERDALRLYDLIWKRFVASQMNPAVFDQTAFDIKAGIYSLRATGQIMRFSGFMAVYLEGEDEEKTKDEEENPTLPELTEGEQLKLLDVDLNQHFTQPPPRFTEASLVKELEEKGIGRPSTYASILSTIQDKEYVVRDDSKRFTPSELGKLVNSLLVESFPDIIDVGFTASMEVELDEIEEGKHTSVQILKKFYKPFAKTVEEASKKMKNVKMLKIETKFKCEKCGSVMVIKWGRHGEFLACDKYPDCTFTQEFSRDADGSIHLKKTREINETCEKCGAPMVLKQGRFGEFLACSKYPDCKTTKSIGLGVKCPECGEGELLQRRSKKGRTFYGCSNYPKCTFALWNKPVNGPCPKCNYPILVEKYTRKTGNTTQECPQKECGYKSNE
ncbi:MAG: type I DNA topoisomerase [Pseudomonadota bacterium]